MIKLPKVIASFFVMLAFLVAAYGIHADAKSGWIQVALNNDQMSYKMTDSIDEYEHQNLLHKAGYLEELPAKKDIVKF